MQVQINKTCISTGVVVCTSIDTRVQALDIVHVYWSKYIILSYTALCLKSNY